MNAQSLYNYRLPLNHAAVRDLEDDLDTAVMNMLAVMEISGDTKDLYNALEHLRAEMRNHK